MAHRQGQPSRATPWTLHLLLPQPGPTPIAAARLRQDQQLGGLGGGLVPVLVPPAPAGVDGNFGGGRRLADGDRAFVALHGIAPIGHAPAQHLGQKRLHVSHLGLSAPGLTGVLEVAQACRVLGIDTDDRLPGSPTGLCVAFHRATLRVTLRVRRPSLFRLGFDAPGISGLWQQPPTVGALAW